MVVPVKSKEAFAFGVSVPIPTLSGFVTPPNTIVLSFVAVAALPIATAFVPCTFAECPIAILFVGSKAVGSVEVAA